MKISAIGRRMATRAVVRTALLPLAIPLFFSSGPMAAQAQMNSGAVGQQCGFISGRSPERNPNSPNDYAYQTSLYRSAGVDPDRDAPAEIRRKMQLWWSLHAHMLSCNAGNFNVPNGSVLKFAVSRRFDEYIRDVADWGVDVNIVDPTDNRTVLDYISDEIVRLDGTSAEPKLRRYYETLRTAGARHRRELREIAYTGQESEAARARRIALSEGPLSPHARERTALCFSIASGSEADFRGLIYRAAAVDPRADGVPEIRRKVQAWWTRMGRYQTCDLQQFYVENGGILKFAANRTDKGFIDDFLGWGVNLNLVDPSDERTVLDYVEDEIVRRGGSAAEPGLRSYAHRLRAAGARNRRELSNVVYTQTVARVP